MPGIVDLREWFTLRGTYADIPEIKQQIENGIETVGAATASARLETLAAENCTVYLEGSDTGQEFITLTSTANDEQTKDIRLSRSKDYGSANRLYKYLRWRVAATSSGDWHATFRVRVILTAAGTGFRREVSGCGPACTTGVLRTADGIIYFQPWMDLEGKGAAAGTVEYPIQPIGRWVDTSNMPTYHILGTLSYAENAKLYLEASPYPEEVADVTHWTLIADRNTVGDFQLDVSTESDDAAISAAGYLRWRIVPTDPADPWSICFKLKVVPGQHVVGQNIQPRR